MFLPSIWSGPSPPTPFYRWISYHIWFAFRSYANWWPEGGWRRKRKGREMSGIYSWKFTSKTLHHDSNHFFFHFLVISCLLLLIFFLATENFYSLLFCLEIWNPLMLGHIRQKALYPDKHLGFKSFTNGRIKTKSKKVGM